MLDFQPTLAFATVLSPAELIAGALICAGAAMLPDLDHPSATIAQTFGPATWLLSKGVNFVSGGHRKATHSLLFAILMGVGAHLLATRFTVGQDILVVLSIGLALRAVGIGVPGNKIASAVVNIVLTAGIFAAFWGLGVSYAWLGFAIGIGCLVHVAGDCLTERGVPGAVAAQAQVAAAVGLGSQDREEVRDQDPRPGALGGRAGSALPAAHARVRMRYLDIKRYSPQVR